MGADGAELPGTLLPLEESSSFLKGDGGRGRWSGICLVFTDYSREDGREGEAGRVVVGWWPCGPRAKAMVAVGLGLKPGRHEVCNAGFFFPK